jgi:anti-sigma B factor antagonist
MNIKERRVGDVLVLDLDGRLILGDGEQLLRDTLDRLIQSGEKRILLNLIGVSYLDSAGIGALVWKYISLKRRDGVLKLLNPQPRVETVLAVTKLLTVLETFESEADAVESFSRPPVSPSAR